MSGESKKPNGAPAGKRWHALDRAALPRALSLVPVKEVYKRVRATQVV